jgi:hypothetical protein
MCYFSCDCGVVYSFLIIDEREADEMRETREECGSSDTFIVQCLSSVLHWTTAAPDNTNISVIHESTLYSRRFVRLVISVLKWRRSMMFYFNTSSYRMAR